MTGSTFSECSVFQGKPFGCRHARSRFTMPCVVCRACWRTFGWPRSVGVFDEAKQIRRQIRYGRSVLRNVFEAVGSSPVGGERGTDWRRASLAAARRATTTNDLPLSSSVMVAKAHEGVEVAADTAAGAETGGGGDGDVARAETDGGASGGGENCFARRRSAARASRC